MRPYDSENRSPELPKPMNKARVMSYMDSTSWKSLERTASLPKGIWLDSANATREHKVN